MCRWRTFSAGSRWPDSTSSRKNRSATTGRSTSRSPAIVPTAWGTSASREAAVLFGRTLKVPEAKPKASAAKTADATSVVVECPELCPQYFARVIRGVKVGPSPAWLRKRLETIGLASINNVVDVTNYVLMECGQPLHAFDFDRLRGRRIVVRQARPGEKLVAINQRTYELQPGMCVIADADRPVALGGVMGGLETEIGPAAKNVLIETANFTPLSIRNTARKLALHSDSSYRFERGVDPAQLDWASRRCCQLILELAGGELLDEADRRRRSHRAEPSPHHAAVRTHPASSGDRRARRTRRSASWRRWALSRKVPPRTDAANLCRRPGAATSPARSI